MERILITLGALVLFAGLESFAQSNLIFFTSTGEPFMLYVNGAQINSTPQSRVEAYDITGEFAQIKVEISGAPTLSKGMALENGKAMTVSIKQNKKGKYVFRPISSSDTKSEPEMITTQEPPQKEPVAGGPVTARVEGKKILLSDGRSFDWKYTRLHSLTGVEVEMKKPLGAKVTLSYDDRVVNESEVPFMYREKDWKITSDYFKLEVEENNGTTWSIKMQHSNNNRLLIY